MPEAVTPTQPCPACGFTVFSRAYGSAETCPVCGWVDDLLQLVQPDLAAGGNWGRSLRQAQAQHLTLHPLTVRQVGGFERHAHWRPLSAAEQTGAQDASRASPVCYLTEPDPDTFEPYWLSADPLE